MTADTSKDLYEFCARAYRATTTRVALSYPAWITSLKRDVDAARVAHVCLQSAALLMMKNPGVHGRCEGLNVENGVVPDDFLATLVLVRQLNEAGAAEALGPALSGLAEYMRFEGGFDSLPNWTLERGETDPLHALATEAAGRNAAAVTPVEVVHFMLLVGLDRKLKGF